MKHRRKAADNYKFNIVIDQNLHGSGKIHLGML